jgi:uncharacterized protein (DUF486 family)
MAYSTLTLGQLKIMQEAITLAVFIPFAVLYMRQPLRLVTGTRRAKRAKRAG